MMMPWGWGMGAGWGFGVFGMVFMLVFWVLIIAGIVLVVRWLVEQGRPGSASGPSGESALSQARRSVQQNTPVGGSTRAGHHRSVRQPRH